MELLEKIKSSLENQSREQGRTLYPSSDRDYITYSLNWDRTIEGYLFWSILYCGYYHQGIYDYITITKLYHRYGRYVFKYEIDIYEYYRGYFDKTTYTLTEEGFEKLCKDLEIHGAVRKD